VDTLGRGDSTLGLANLAGSALLSNVQNIVGDALGLSEFRLFPTIITNDEKRTSALGLSAEAGVDISRSFSVSVLKELTNDQPFQYSLRYRLNEQTLLRGFTDLSGESGAIVEYERRF
jgi:translocation and assembly module TamB